MKRADIRTLAARSLAEQRRKEADQQEQAKVYHHYLIREAIGKVLGVALAETDVTPTDFFLVVDGLTFVYPTKLISPLDLRLVYTCDTCDKTLFSVKIKDLAHLGAMLEEAELDSHETCSLAGGRHRPVHYHDHEPGTRKKGVRTLEVS